MRATRFIGAAIFAVAAVCALKLYGAHIALTLAALVIFACAWWMSGVDDLIAAHGRSFIFGSPASGLAGLVLLSHQLGYFNILPLYVVLMLWTPLALAIAMRSPGLAVFTSGSIYAGSRALGLELPTWPEAGGWFFNPFAWQLVFTIGLVCPIVWRDGAPQPRIPATTNESVLGQTACGDVTRGGGIPSAAMWRYADRHD